MIPPPSARGQVTLLPIATARRTWQASAALLRQHPVLLVATLVALLASGVAVVFVPALLGRLVDVVTGSGGTTAVDLIAVGLLVALLARAMFTGLGELLLARLGEQVLARLRERVVRRALDTPLDTVERSGTGDLVQRTGGDITVISEGLRSAIPAVATAMIDVVLTLVGLTVLDWRLGLAGLAPLPIWIIATRWYLRTSGPRYAAERARRRGSDPEPGQQPDRCGDRTRVPAAGPPPAPDPARPRTRPSGPGCAARTTSAQFGAVLNGAEMVGVLSILLAGFLLVRSEAITLGAATAAAFYFTRLFSPLMRMLYLLDEAQSAGAALARLIGVTDLPAPAVPAAPRTPRDASIALSGIRFGYEDGPEVLHGIDLALVPGERVAVVGTTGAGKTTLGALAAGVREPRDGEVRIGGVPLGELADLRRHVVLVTQEVHVFAGTVADNLRLARPDAADADLRAALTQVGVDLDLDAVVGHGADELSATHAQQLALTRLVLADPDIAILDEATAEAGSAGARVLEATAERALRGRTAIVIAHRLTQAVTADRVVVMDKGRVVEVGRHEDLVRADGPYARLWSAWTSAR